MHADALLAAILDDPDDDAPRLIYADWLDDEGEADRAAFIRIQCALARMEIGDERRLALRRREGELLRRYEAEWVGALPAFASGWRFARGFVDQVLVVAEAFLAEAATIFRVAPVRHIKVVGLRDNAAALAAEPELARLASLDLSFTGLTMAGLRAFAASPHLGGLRVLDLRWNPLPQAPRVLAAARLPRLADLDLEKTGCSAEAVARVAATPVFDGLKRLSLRENGLPDAAALAAAAGLSSLRVLDLRDNPLGPDEEPRLARRFGADVCLVDA